MRGGDVLADVVLASLVNLPICGLALGGLLAFMRVSSGASDTERLGIGTKFRRLDIVGNLIFPPSKSSTSTNGMRVS